MRGFCFDVACLCGGEFTVVNGAHPSCCEACAVVKCSHCNHEYGVHVSLQSLAPLAGELRRRQHRDCVTS